MEPNENQIISKSGKHRKNKFQRRSNQLQNLKINLAESQKTIDEQKTHIEELITSNDQETEELSEWINHLQNRIFNIEENIILKMERIDEEVLATSIVQKQFELQQGVINIQEKSNKKDCEAKNDSKIEEENWLLNKLRQTERQKMKLEMFIKQKNLTKEYDEFESNLENA